MESEELFEVPDIVCKFPLRFKRKRKWDVFSFNEFVPLLNFFIAMFSEHFSVMVKSNAFSISKNENQKRVQSRT